MLAALAYDISFFEKLLFLVVCKLGVGLCPGTIFNFIGLSLLFGDDLDSSLDYLAV